MPLNTNRNIQGMAEKQATKQTFFATLRDRIARDELDAALAQLHELLAHSPLLDEIVKK